ncbi:hypothetical protein RRG08_061885 [Elysia crispata]|uniref:Uncharacterized protein n=1 Tax=Elysia crispata TaxID=231223 RepID=A0AAE1CIH7_9GAST|nr:hypothetical protein RRG08_061885 [Elysia crispata]
MTSVCSCLSLRYDCFEFPHMADAMELLGSPKLTSMRKQRPLAAGVYHEWVDSTPGAEHLQVYLQNQLRCLSFSSPEQSTVACP